MTLYDAKDTLESREQILLSGLKFTKRSKSNNQYELTGEDKKQLDNLVRNDRGEQNLKNIAAEFAKSDNIYLHFIAQDRGTYRIINEEFSPNATKQQGRAFVVLNSDYTVCGVLSVLFKNKIFSQQLSAPTCFIIT